MSRNMFGFLVSLIGICIICLAFSMSPDHYDAKAVLGTIGGLMLGTGPLIAK